MYVISHNETVSMLRSAGMRSIVQCTALATRSVSDKRERDEHHELMMRGGLASGTLHPTGHARTAQASASTIQCMTRVGVLLSNVHLGSCSMRSSHRCQHM